MIGNAIQKYETFYNIVVYLSSQKINLLVFFNFLVVVLVNLINLLVWIFFEQIRTIESKYIMDKSQKKLFHFLLLTLILRSTFDIYKFISLSILFSFWVLHWLVYKRSDYLISRGSRGKLEHAKLFVLYNMLIFVDFVVSYTFYDKFAHVGGERMNEIYVIIGFEFFRLLLKSIEDSFQYCISLVELMYREQWTEKSFVFNIISFIFDLIVLMLNMKLFAYIISRQQFPLYMLGEIIDNFVRLGKSVQLFIQSRSLINKLKRLPDVSQTDLVGMDNTCIICLEEIKKAKKLNCGHIFHLNCLRRWLEQNVQCPTCRCKIELVNTANGGTIANARNRDGNGAAMAGDQGIHARLQNARRRHHNRRRDTQFVPGEGGDQAQQQPQPDNEEEKKEDSINNTKFMDELTKELIEETKKINSSTPIKQTSDVNQTSGSSLKKQKIESNNSIKELFKIDEEELMDLIEEQNSLANEQMKSNESYNEDDNFGIGINGNEGFKERYNGKNNGNISGVKENEKEPSLLKRNELGFAKTINKTLFESYEDDVQPGKQTFTQNPYDLKIGSVPYGLPCIALTRRTLDVSLKSKQIEMINEKICRILRQPADFVDINDDQTSEQPIN